MPFESGGGSGPWRSLVLTLLPILLILGLFLYFLRRQDILTGSERLRIEVRDKDSQLVSGVVHLRPTIDYDIDYLQGRILLTERVRQVFVEGAVPRPLDQPATERIVPRSSHRDAGSAAHAIDGLHERLAKGRLADDERSIVVLQGARHDLGERCGHDPAPVAGPD